MQKSILISIFCLAIGCNTTNDMKENKNTISLSTLPQEQTINVKLNEGKTYSYTASVHGSVGQALEMSLSDKVSASKVIDITEEFAYKDKERAKMPGGDAATKTYTIKPVGTGNATITFSHGFRGDVQQEVSFHFVVQ